MHTIADTKKYIAAVNHPGVKHINGDVYHMQSEESHTGEAILDAGEMLTNLHMADSNRCALGMGSFDLDTLIMALYLVGYNQDGKYITPEPLGPGGDPYPAMHGKPNKTILDELVKQTASYIRERFLEVMNFNPNVHSIKWEFGYWGETIQNWYKSGLPMQKYPVLSKNITTPTSSLYSPAWTCRGVNKLPNGIGVMAGGLYWPTQGFPLDNDVRAHFKMDYTQRLVDVNPHFAPMFAVKVLAEDDKIFEYIDVDGVRRVLLKDEATIPTSLEWPIKDRATWEKLKAKRLNLKNIKERFPSNWSELVKEYKNRDYPLALGGYPHGFFGTPAHLIGYENLFLWYCLEPELMHDIMNTFTNIWLAVFEEVLSQVEIDHWQIWEDISFGKGSMISIDMVREFICPYIKKIADFLKTKGVNIVLLDTDGDCNNLIPVFMEAGVTGMYPLETHCGMDIIKVRKQYPKLQMLGGIPKSEITKGKNRIDEILEPVNQVLKTGGYIPFGDHFIPPDVDFENFSYYRNRLNELIDKYGK